MRWIWAAMIVLGMGAAAWSDEVTDCLEKALVLYKKGNYIGAQRELAKALAVVEPKAIAQTPPPTVKELTYFNYEQSFCVAAPGKDWRIQPLVAKTTPTGVTMLVTITFTGNEDNEVGIFCVQNLRQALGSRFWSVAGNEMAVMKAAASNPANFVQNVKDCSTGTNTELKVAGKPALRTEYTGKLDGKNSHCMVVQAITGERLFTGVFLSTEVDWPQRSKDFENMVGTMAFDVPIPEPVDAKTGKTK
jgi:hypothetical protein